MEENKKENPEDDFDKMIGKTINLSKSDWQKLKIHCKDKGLKPGTFIRTLIKDYLKSI